MQNWCDGSNEMIYNQWYPNSNFEFWIIVSSIWVRRDDDEELRSVEHLIYNMYRKKCKFEHAMPQFNFLCGDVSWSPKGIRTILRFDSRKTTVEFRLHPRIVAWLLEWSSALIYFGNENKTFENLVLLRRFHAMIRFESNQNYKKIWNISLAMHTRWFHKIYECFS